MARSKLIDYIELSNLSSVLQEKSDGHPKLKDILEATGLPSWFVYELAGLGYIGDKALSEKALICIETAMFCMRSHRFIGNGLNRLSVKQRKFLLETRNLSSLEKWIRSRIESLKTADKRIFVSQIFREVCAYFPNIGEGDLKMVKRIIESQKRAYRRSVQKGKTA